jgi:hypothetical protein
MGSENPAEVRVAAVTADFSLRKVSIGDRRVLADLARRYRDACETEENLRKIEFWRDFNSLRPTRAPVFIDLNYATHMDAEIDAALPAPRVESPVLRPFENWFQRRLWQTRLPDDRVVYPWYPVRAIMETNTAGEWGIELALIRDTGGGRGWRWDAVISKVEDLARLTPTPHRVLDPDPPLARVLRDIFGDILPVHVDRSTVYSPWGGYDLSTAAGALLGLQELLLALYEEPDLVHGLMAFMRDAVIANLRQGEVAGDWSPAESNNYAVPSYCHELPDPRANAHGVRLKDLHLFMHAQEFETVSPEQHEEFLLRYQMPIMNLFGLVNYGCCESLHNKIVLLRTIPNLRKILSGPIADLRKVVEAVGSDYIISWRPNPAVMVACGFDSSDVRRRIREALVMARGCRMEIILKELLTVQGDMNRLVEWARIARDEAEADG